MAQTIAVVKWKGGVGATSIAVALAERAHRDGRRVAVVDADPQRSASRWLATAAPELPVYGVEPDPTDPGGAVLRALDAASGAADLVICDVPPSAPEVLRALALAADVALIPTGAAVEEVVLAGRALEVLRSVGPYRPGREPARALVVLTRIDRRTGLGRDAEQTAGALDAPLARAALSYRTAWPEAASAGVPLHALGSRATEAVRELEELWTEVLELVGVAR